MLPMFTAQFRLNSISISKVVPLIIKLRLTLQKYRWRAGKGIQRSESARLITMRTPSLAPRQNSHPNLVHQASFSSSSSSLADRSSVESPSKLTTYSLSNSDQNYQVHILYLRSDTLNESNFKL